MMWLIETLLGVRAWIKDALATLWTAALERPREATIIVLLALCGLLAWQSSGQRKAITRLEADKALIIAAQKEAQRKWTAEKLRIETRSKELAHAADEKAGDLRVVYRDRVLWKAAHQGAACSAGGSQADVSQGSDGSGAGSVLLISTDDALICADNTARLQAGHEWAIKSIAENE